MADRRLWFKHKCIVCKLLFVSERDLVLHEKTHEKPKFVCSSCSEVFESEQQCNFHVSICSKSNGKAHACKTCGAVFEQVRDLYDHRSTMHVDEYKFQCKVCWATFSWLENLEKHELLHQTNSSMCKSCGAIFGSMASLKVHLWKAHSVNIRDQNDHMLQMPVACQSNCQNCKSIGTSERLCLHCEKSILSGSAIARNGDEKPYKCQLCNWTFKYDFSYSMHMKTHEEKQLQNNMLAKVTSNKRSWDGTQIQEKAKVSSSGSFSSSQERIMAVTKPSDSDVLIHTPTNGKKTIYVRRVNLPFNVSSNSKVVLADKNQEQKTHMSKEGTISKAFQGYASAPVSSDIIVRNKLPIGKSREKQTQSRGCGAFTCKTCMVTFQYDFSYMAHMKYHEAVKHLDSVSNEAEVEKLSHHQHFRTVHVSNDSLSSLEISVDGSGTDSQNREDLIDTVLVKVDDLVQQKQIDNYTLQMYSLSDGRNWSLASDKSPVKYIVLHPSENSLVAEMNVASDGACFIEEVVNTDSSNSAAAGVAYMPEELKGCLVDSASKHASNVAQVIIVENQDNSECFLNSEVPLTRQLELDGVDSGAVMGEQIESEMVESAKTINEAYYGDLLGDRTASINDLAYSSLASRPDIQSKYKMTLCSVSQAEKCLEANLYAHRSTHVKEPVRGTSNIQILHNDLHLQRIM